MYQKVFNELLKRMSSFMKQHSFLRKGNNFSKRNLEGNIGIINFQRNKEGFPKFTINLGIYSLVLAEFFLYEFNENKVKDNPSIIDTHWHMRIGSIVPIQHPARKKDEDWLKGRDKWWWYDDSTDIEALCNEIKDLIITFAIPAINEHITDNQLQKKWLLACNSEELNHRSWLLLRDLSVLLKHLRKEKELELLTSHFKKMLEKDPNDEVVKRHLDKLRETKEDTNKITSDKESVSSSL